jgi:hypothetical protein
MLTDYYYACHFNPLHCVAISERLIVLTCQCRYSGPLYSNSVPHSRLDILSEFGIPMELVRVVKKFVQMKRARYYACNFNPLHCFAISERLIVLTCQRRYSGPLYSKSVLHSRLYILGEFSIPMELVWVLKKIVKMKRIDVITDEHLSVTFHNQNGLN